MVNDKQMQEIYESAFIHVNFNQFKQRHHQ